MSIGSEADPSALEHLSALTDGELDSVATARACGSWRDDSRARSTWHTYQSEDLSSSSSHDAWFLAALRARLADEPVVLAPDPVSQPMSQPIAAPHIASGGRSPRWSWMAPTAVAAGFVLVTGALLVTRGPSPAGGGSDSMLARIGFGGPAASQVTSLPTMVAGDPNMEPQTVVLTGKVLRDARIDRYLDAHQRFAGTSALGVPSGFLRNAAAEAPTH